MGITFAVRTDAPVITIVASGPITRADILAHLEKERDAGILPFARMADAREMRPEFDAADVQDVVMWIRAAAPAPSLGPTAVVVGSDAAFGLIRMFQMRLEEEALVRPFRDHETAERWLQSQID